MTGRLDGARLEELFDPIRALRNLDVVFDRLAKIDTANGGTAESMGGSGS